jgi:pentatricopeptide repeat protein
VLSYNATINACSKCGDLQKALQLQQHMLAGGLTPDVRNYTATIDACSKGGQYQQAAGLLHEMAARGLTPDVRTYTAAIDAYSKGGQYEMAIDLLHEMIAAGVAPDVACYTAVIDACAQRSQAERAYALLQEMKAAGCQPNASAYTAAVDACKNSCSWQLVPQLLLQLHADGVVPTVKTYTAAADALHTAQQDAAADCVYAAACSAGAVQHWTGPHTGRLDFHSLGTGLAVAAARLVLRDMVPGAVTGSTVSTSRYVHNPAVTLFIITGHAASREGKDGSVVQKSIMSLLNSRGIACSLEARNKGVIEVQAAELQKYVARSHAQLRNETH